jgi:hypothetical protein
MYFDMFYDFEKPLNELMDALKKEPNQINAENIIKQIFYCGPAIAGPFSNTSDQEAAKLLEQVIQLFPLVDLNYPIRPSNNRADRFRAHRDENMKMKRERLFRNLPTYLVHKILCYIVGNEWVESGTRTGEGVHFFSSCPPLILASHFNMPAVMKVLLQQPTIDVTVKTNADDRVGHYSLEAPKITAYAIAPMMAFTCKKMLKEAAIKQFYGEAITAVPSKITALVGRYLGLDITPKEMREFVFKQIKGRVEAEENFELKSLLLQKEYDQINLESSLKAFLGDPEMDMLKNAMTKIQQPTATAVPTVTFVDSNVGRINNGDPGPSSGASIFSKFTMTSKK